MADEVNWDLIELDYRAGVLPVSAVAKKHGVSSSVLRTHAQKYMWERRPLDPFTVVKAHGVASDQTRPSGPKYGMDSVLSPPDLEQSAVLTAAAILTVHRKDVAKLREMSSKFSDALASVFAVLDEANFKSPEEYLNGLGMVTARLGVLIGSDTPADLLEKLSRVMVRLVTVERQAYGLDVIANPDLGANDSDAVKSEVNKLWEQVKSLQKEKTLH